MTKNTALFNALFAYFLWGLAPIYWKQISHIGSAQIVAHRMLWSFIFILIIVIAMRQWPELHRVVRDQRQRKLLFIAAVLNCVNWAVFIWAVNANYLVEVSMGYFINPLMTVLLGIVLFKERLNHAQMFALLCVFTGVGYLVFLQGYLPWIALSLGGSFAMYGAVKKSMTVSATVGMTVETGFFVIPALIFLLICEYNQAGGSGFGVTTSDNLWLIFCGLLTLTPLVLFASAAKNLSLTTLGMGQYIGPTLHLCIAIFLYKEPFDQAQFVAFSMIWLALIIYSVDQFRQRKPQVHQVI